MKYKNDHVRVLKVLGAELPKRPAMNTADIVAKGFKGQDDGDRRARNAYRMLRKNNHIEIADRGDYRLTSAGATFTTELAKNGWKVPEAPKKGKATTVKKAVKTGSAKKTAKATKVAKAKKPAVKKPAAKKAPVKAKPAAKKPEKPAVKKPAAKNPSIKSKPATSNGKSNGAAKPAAAKPAAPAKEAEKPASSQLTF